MGLPALRHEPSVTRTHQRPRLRVVKPAARPGVRKRTRTSHADAYQAFVFFAVVVAAIAVLGLGRVWLSVQAAQASIDAGKLRRDIKVERYRGDLLEVQQSALATPSRIQAIAGRTMGMAPATAITYLRLKSEKPGAVAAAQPTIVPAQARADSGVLRKVMDAAAGEAQLLLVGDVGLSSSK